MESKNVFTFWGLRPIAKNLPATGQSKLQQVHAFLPSLLGYSVFWQLWLTHLLPRFQLIYIVRIRCSRICLQNCLWAVNYNVFLDPASVPANWHLNLSKGLCQSKMHVSRRQRTDHTTRKCVGISGTDCAARTIPPNNNMELIQKLAHPSNQTFKFLDPTQLTTELTHVTSHVHVWFSVTDCTYFILSFLHLATRFWALTKWFFHPSIMWIFRPLTNSVSRPIKQDV